MESIEKFCRLSTLKKTLAVAAAILGAVITPFFLCLGGVALFQLSVKWLNRLEFPKKSTAELDDFTGKATITTSNGGTYTGQFKDGLYDGYGVLCENGRVYKGEFSRGQKCGFGRYYENGIRIYFGNWEENQINGNGELRVDNQIYSGNFYRGQKCGLGTYYEYREGDDRKSWNIDRMYANPEAYPINLND